MRWLKRRSFTFWLMTTSTCFLVCLKLFFKLEWHWVWVLCPLWFPVFFMVFAVAIWGFVFVLVDVFFGR